MAKLTSLSDLGSLLSEEEKKNVGFEQNVTTTNEKKKAKTGYDGRSQRLTVKLDAKKRGGKRVTVISGFQSNPKELEELFSFLKKRCAAGGAILDNAIEIQGDHRNSIVNRLRELGYEAIINN